MASLNSETVKSCLQENLLLGVENCFVDVLATVDREFLNRHGLKKGDQIFAGEEHKKLYDELLERSDLDFRAGGATHNAIKIAQWMLQDPRKIVTFVGCSGKDKAAEICKQDNEKYNIGAYLYETDAHPTCTAVCCTYAHFRSVIAYTRFLHSFKSEFMDTQFVQNLIHNAKYIYMTSYYLTVSGEILLELAQHSSKNGKVFMLGLSATYICTHYTEPLMKLIPHVDILFGNKYEALAFAEANKFNTTDIKAIVSRIQALPKENSTRERIVVITQGPDDVVVATKDGVTFYPVNHVDKEKIIDTTAAGDSFAGGFMSQLLLNKSLDECVRAGNYAASIVIQHIGCTVPEKPNYI